MNNIFDSISMGFIVLGIIILIVSSISIINTMSMAVIERTKSIGIMKSVGASCNNIKTMFLSQSAVIGFLGGTIGIIVGSVINIVVEKIINDMMIENSFVNASLTISLPYYFLILIIVFAMLISLLAGLIPAIRASKLNAVEAIRK